MSTTKVSSGFWVITIILVLWNLLGVLAFLGQISMTDQAISLLSAPEQELYSHYSLWTTIVYGVAVIAGFTGAILLLMKRKSAKLVFILSLLAILIQMGHSLIVAKAMDVYGAMPLIMAIVVTFIGAFCIWYTSYCKNRSWLK